VRVSLRAASPSWGEATAGAEIPAGDVVLNITRGPAGADPLAESYQLAITRQGPPEPSSHGIKPTYAVAPLGGMQSSPVRFSIP
jgi:hypothetical protein